MTRFQSRSANLASVAAASLFTALTFGAALAPSAADAKSNGVFYRAELAQPVGERTTTIAGGVAWQCQGTTCVAAKGNSRPLRMCRELQREHGEITTFTAREKVLDEGKLARCNG